MRNRVFILIFLLLIFSYFSYFLRLTSYPVLMWDEGRYAVSAFEMIKNHDPIVIYYDSKPDMWSTKPPLYIWILALSIKLFGYGELALRLPSAIASLLTTLLIFYFVLKKTGSSLSAFFSGMVLLSSIGFIGVHISRSADSDAVAVLFTTLSAIIFYAALDDPSRKINVRKLYTSALFFALATLTKSVFPFFIVPGMLVFLIVTRRANLLSSKHFYISILAAITPWIIYAVLREHYNPGYIQASFENDLSGRYFNTLENHAEPFNFYFLNLLTNRFFYWFIVVLIAIPTIFYDKNSQEKSLKAFGLLIGFFVLIFISISKTKLTHYDALVYPFFSITVGITLKQLLQQIQTGIKISRPVQSNILAIIFFAIIFYYPYRMVLSYINIKPFEAAALNLKYGPFMKELYKNKDVAEVNFYESQYNSHLLYYNNVYNELEKNGKIVHNIDSLSIGDLITTCDPAKKADILKRYSTEVYLEDKYCSCYKIK
jgi:4-amino-4-deoxy-L-arabinose transferase-like glycosyltransferase